MKSLIRMRYLRIAGFAAGAVAVAGAAIVVTASAAGLNFGFHPSSSAEAAPSPKATTMASSVCNDFLSHFASDLGKSQSQVNTAFQKAIGETLADEVKNGQLTQSQADAIKQKLTNQPPCALAGNLGRSKKPSKLPIHTQELLSAAAAALGISEQQLSTDLANGMTLSQIAAARNPPVTEAQFRTRLIANLKPLLDAAVANKRLTAAQEQEIIQRLQTGPIPYWNEPMRHKSAPASPKPATT